MSKIRKPENILELGPVEISAAKNLISRTSEQVWDLENERKENDFDVFHHTRHIIFRFIEGMCDHRKFYSNPNWAVWKDVLLPLMQNVVANYDFKKPEFPKVMLARLAASAVIDRHKDGAGSNLYTHKIHIPIITNENAYLLIRDQQFHLREGIAYEVNNLVSHGAENLGSEDRIHLIFEVFDSEGQIEV